MYKIVKENNIDKLEKRMSEMAPISTMLDKGLTPEEIVGVIYKDIEEANILDKQDVIYM